MAGNVKIGGGSLHYSIVKGKTYKPGQPRKPILLDRNPGSKIRVKFRLAGMSFSSPALPLPTRLSERIVIEWW